MTSVPQHPKLLATSKLTATYYHFENYGILRNSWIHNDGSWSGSILMASKWWFYFGPEDSPSHENLLAVHMLMKNAGMPSLSVPTKFVLGLAPGWFTGNKHGTLIHLHRPCRYVGRLSQLMHTFDKSRSSKMNGLLQTGVKRWAGPRKY